MPDDSVVKERRDPVQLARNSTSAGYRHSPIFSDVGLPVEPHTKNQLSRGWRGLSRIIIGEEVPFERIGKRPVAPTSIVTASPTFSGSLQSCGTSIEVDHIARMKTGKQCCRLGKFRLARCGRFEKPDILPILGGRLSAPSAHAAGAKIPYSMLV